MYGPLADAFRQMSFDEVELVGLGERGITFARKGESDEAVTWTRTLSEAQRSSLHALLTALPNDESARCHMPGFGLRITSGGQHHRVSLCFRCNNAYVADVLMTFSAPSSEGQTLLAFLKGIVPLSASSSE